MKAKISSRPIYISLEKKERDSKRSLPRQTTQEKEQQSIQKYFFLTAAIALIESFPRHIAPTFSFSPPES